MIWRIAAVLLLALSTSAARGDGASFVITPESRLRGLSLASSERIFEDETAKLGLDDVRALAPANFFPLDKFDKFHFTSAYWMRADVRSELPVDRWYIVSASWWDHQDIFNVRADGSVTQMASGLLKVPKDSNDKFYPTFLIRAGEALTLFVRLKSTGMFHPPDSAVVYLSDATSRHEVVLPYTYFGGMVFGMLLALALYNLLVAQSTRDKAYLFYGLYLFALAISLAGYMDPYASNLNQYFLPNHPSVAMWMKRLSDPAAWILLLLFDRAFLETPRYLPTWDKVFIAMAVLVALWDLTGFFPWYNDLDNAFTRGFGWIATVQNHVLVLMGVAAGIIRYRQGFEPAKYFVAAQIILAIATILQLHPTDSAWHPLNYLPDGVFWRYVRNEQLWIGAAIEAIIFSMGLSHRINLLRAAVARQALEAEQERKRVAIEHKERLEVEVAERTQELRVEKENASRLLHNILPVDVANELIAHGATDPQRYDEVSILYTDFKGFTNAVASLPAKRLVEELNDIFQHFDDIIDACGIEKIKTIGDAYMIAGGLPKALPDHAERCVDTALKMLAYLAERNRTSALKWNMRAGIHSGAVIAGVVGKRKFTYDVWGDTVNIASRMESAGEPGRVNVSAYTYDLVKSKYKGEYRGKLDAKGKGEIDMYFVVP